MAAKPGPRLVTYRNQSTAQLGTDSYQDMGATAAGPLPEHESVHEMKEWAPIFISCPGICPFRSFRGHEMKEMALAFISWPVSERAFVRFVDSGRIKASGSFESDLLPEQGRSWGHTVTKARARLGKERYQDMGAAAAGPLPEHESVHEMKEWAALFISCPGICPFRPFRGHEMKEMALAFISCPVSERAFVRFVDSGRIKASGSFESSLLPEPGRGCRHTVTKARARPGTDSYQDMAAAGDIP